MQQYSQVDSVYDAPSKRVQNFTKGRFFALISVTINDKRLRNMNVLRCVIQCKTGSEVGGNFGRKNGDSGMDRTRLRKHWNLIDNWKHSRFIYTTTNGQLKQQHDGKSTQPVQTCSISTSSEAV